MVRHGLTVGGKAQFSEGGALVLDTSLRTWLVLVPTEPTFGAVMNRMLQRRRMRRGWNWLLLSCFLLLGCPVAVVGDEGSKYLDSKQFQVEQLAMQALDNYNHQCELLATCNNPSNCSHSVCEPLLGDTDDLTCTTVVRSPYCSDPGSNTPCTSMNLDYRRGYVRVAATANLGSVDTMLAICSQRALDPLMRSFTSNLSDRTRLYYAPMDGSWRVLPGSARSVADCRNYDARLRTWFRTSTSVVKVVTVLIDLAASMNSNLPPSFGVGTMLQAAKNIAAQLLTTLSANDYVNFIVFNSTGAYRISPEAILVQEHLTTDQPELQPLLEALNGQKVESQYRQSNLTAAILAALPNFESNPLAAKLILVISDFVFASLANVTLPSKSLSGIKTFLYKLPRSNDLDIYLENSTLIRQLCAVGGHFEPILRNLENPLLALSKFFSYLANLKRVETNGLPQYSSTFPEFENIGGNITTLTKPVFSKDGELIGVVGITIYLELLGNLTSQVKNALLGRVTGYTVPTNPIVLTAANCSIVNETAQPCGGSSAYYADNGGLCAKTDLTSTIQDLACCKTCDASRRTGNSRKLGAGVVAGIVVGSLLGVGLLILGAVYAYPRCRKRWEKIAARKTRDVFPPDAQGQGPTKRRF